MSGWYSHENTIELKDGSNVKEYRYTFETFDKEQAVRVEKFMQNEMDKKHDKYAWHDLRKDPEDLPKGNGCYLVYVFSEGDINWGINDHYYFLVGKWAIDYFYNINDCYEVIAWKEIEQFEEV